MGAVKKTGALIELPVLMWYRKEFGMLLYLRLAWRNLWRHRRRTMLVVLAMGMGLMLMMFYDGFVSGFENAIYGNAIKVLGGNIQVHADGYSEGTGTAMLPLPNASAVVRAAEGLPQVAAAAQRINTGGMITNREGAFSISIVGIEPEKEQPVNLIAQNVSEGRFLTAGDRDVVYIGSGLAKAMDASIGDRVTLVGRATHNQMRQRTMTVGGIYDVGMPEIEKRTVYMSLGEAQELYDLRGQVTEVAISLHNLGEEEAVMTALAPVTAGTEIGSWQTNFPELQSALSTKGGVMDVFSVIILAIAGIGILNLLLMAVFERTREIGLLGALGFKPRQITTLFLIEGAMMGVIGLLFGIGLGLLMNAILATVGVDYSKFASVTEYTALISGRVYPTLGLEKIAQRGLTVLIVAILAAYYPAREAARHEPAQALHTV